MFGITTAKILRQVSHDAAQYEVYILAPYEEVTDFRFSMTKPLPKKIITKKSKPDM